jgi:hypothetical protein
LSFKDKFWNGTSDAQHFLTIDQIEQLVTELQSSQRKIDVDTLINDIRAVKGEDLIIAEKKTNINRKG